MARFEPTTEQARRVAKKAHNVVDRTLAGGLDPEAVSKALQEIYSWKGGIPLVLAKDLADKPKLFKRSNGTYGLKTTRLGLSDDRIVADFKASGWNYVDLSIRADRRSVVPGKPEIAVGTTRTLTIASVVPSGETWEFQKVVDTIGTPALAFDLEDLRDLVLGREDELLKRSVRYIAARAARFRRGYGGLECVAYADLKRRQLCLNWVERDWDARDWLGSCK